MTPNPAFKSGKKGTDLFSGKNEKGDIMAPLDDVVRIADYHDSKEKLGRIYLPSIGRK